ncbi:MAG: helix-turn-helix domain-containing protein [Dehalococcoidia bacterium]
MVAGRDGDLLTLAEAARLLRVSRITVHRWVQRGRLPSYRVGPKAIRIPAATWTRSSGLCGKRRRPCKRLSMTSTRP